MLGNFDTKFSKTNVAVNNAAIDLLSDILDNHSDLLILCDNNLNVLKLNKSAEQVFLVSEKTEAPIPLIDLLPDLNENNLIDKIYKSINETTSSEFICNIANITYCIKLAKINNQILLRLIDIAPTTAQTDTLESSNFKMLFENMTSGFLFLKLIENKNSDVDFEIIDLNSTFEMYFEVERQNIIGQSLSTALPAISTAFANKLQRIATHGRTAKDVFENLATYKHLDVRLYSPRIGYAAAIFNDIKSELEIRNDLLVKNEISKAFALGFETDVYQAIITLLQHHTQSPYAFIGYPISYSKIKILAINDPQIEAKIVKIDDESFIELEPVATEILWSNKQQVKCNIAGHNHMLLTPILNRDVFIGVIGLSDSPKEYDKKSCDFVLSFANYAAPLMENEIKDYHYKKELIQAKEIAERNEKLKMSFLGNISHEIRTPLNSITGFSDLLIKAEDLPPKIKRWSEVIYKSSRQLLTIITSIVELSKIETKQISINNTTFSLNKLIDDVYDSYKSKADTKGLKLVQYKDLDQYASNIYNDRQKLHQIMSTLVDNGLKFTEQGEVSFGYRYMQNQQIEFFVKDTGIGIRAERQQEIFTPFIQVETTLERSYGGVGIGLSICNKYVEMLGSHIRLESKPGMGSLFHFIIDYKTQPESAINY